MTTDDNFTHYRTPDLDPAAPPVPPGDFIAGKAPMYYVSVDPRGVLGWQENTVTYETTTAQVIEVPTGQASNAYKAVRRQKGISYLLAGEDKRDYALLLEKLKGLFGIQVLMLGGGGVLNWSFLQAGLCDEVSIVVAPAADGNPTTQSLFLAKEGLSTDKAISFTLLGAQAAEGNALWLRYRVDPQETNHDTEGYPHGIYHLSQWRPDAHAGLWRLSSGPGGVRALRGPGHRRGLPGHRYCPGVS